MSIRLAAILSASDLLHHLLGSVVLLNTDVNLVSNRHQKKLVSPKWMAEIGIGWLFWLLNTP